MKFLFVLLITFTNTCVWSQEFVGYKSEDLVMMLEKRFLRNTERSNFIDQYNQENGSYPKRSKTSPSTGTNTTQRHFCSKKDTSSQKARHPLSRKVWRHTPSTQKGIC